MTKIKICGLTRPEDIDAVNMAKPDYIGFVFVSGRKRTVNVQTAASLRKRLDKSIKAVGVFLENDIKTIETICQKGIIDIVQLHGSEDEAYISELKSRISIPVIKAVSVRTQEDIMQAEMLSADFLLLDTYRAGKPGGTGKSFDWSMIPKLKKPFFLAGGINEGNIDGALCCGAYAIDVSSGAETDGKKDIRKIINLVRKVRGD